MVLALGTVVTALAGPVKGLYEFDQTYGLFNCKYFGGGDFRILNHEVGASVDKYYYDEYNLIYRVKYHLEGVNYLYAEFDPENVITGNFVLNGELLFDPPVPFPPWGSEPAQIHIAGNEWSIQLPGSGNVFHHTINLIFKDGEFVREYSLEDRDFEAICEYFGQFAPSP
jgi:hypothetical protein